MSRPRHDRDDDVSAVTVFDGKRLSGRKVRPRPRDRLTVSRGRTSRPREARNARFPTKKKKCPRQRSNLPASTCFEIIIKNIFEPRLLCAFANSSSASPQRPVSYVAYDIAADEQRGTTTTNNGGQTSLKKNENRADIVSYGQKRTTPRCSKKKKTRRYHTKRRVRPAVTKIV